MEADLRQTPWRLGKLPFVMRWCYFCLNFGYAA
jgi:hypothetical protein